MSRAFAPGESEDDEERFVVKATVLPPGTPNYITPAGARALEAERGRLIAEKAALSDSVEDKQRIKTLDQRLMSLTDRIRILRILPPESQPKDRIAFGATVTLSDGKTSHEWRIVGVDEVDLKKGWISWISPLAKNLLDKRVGDACTMGDQRWTIKNVNYV